MFENISAHSQLFRSSTSSARPILPHHSSYKVSPLAQNSTAGIEYKVISIIYKTLQSGQPYLSSLLSVQSNRTTRASEIITLQRPSTRSRLKVTVRSFTHHAPVLWNFLPKQLRQPSAPQSLDTTTDSILLYLPFPRISSTLNSKHFSLNNPFLVCLVRTNSCWFSDPLTYI